MSYSVFCYLFLCHVHILMFFFRPVRTKVVYPSHVLWIACAYVSVTVHIISHFKLITSTLMLLSRRSVLYHTFIFPHPTSCTHFHYLYSIMLYHVLSRCQQYYKLEWFVPRVNSSGLEPHRSFVTSYRPLSRSVGGVSNFLYLPHAKFRNQRFRKSVRRVMPTLRHSAW